MLMPPMLLLLLHAAVRIPGKTNYVGGAAGKGNFFFPPIAQILIYILSFPPLHFSISSDVEASLPATSSLTRDDDNILRIPPKKGLCNSSEARVAIINLGNRILKQ
jgi:hypothetical protein